MERRIYRRLLGVGVPVDAPRMHDLSQRLGVARGGGETLPPDVRAGAELNPYAVAARYPGLEPVTEDEYVSSG